MKERITFSIRKDLVKEIDECAKSLNMNRSQFIDWILKNNLPKAKIVAKAMKDVFTQSVDDVFGKE